MILTIPWPHVCVCSVQCSVTGSVWAYNTTLSFSASALNVPSITAGALPKNSTLGGSTNLTAAAFTASVASNVTQYVTSVDLALLCCGPGLFGVR